MAVSVSVRVIQRFRCCQSVSNCTFCTIQRSGVQPTRLLLSEIRAAPSGTGDLHASCTERSGCRGEAHQCLMHLLPGQCRRQQQRRQCRSSCPTVDMLLLVRHAAEGRG